MIVGPLSADEIRRAVQLALAEDLGAGDVTTLALVPESAAARAMMRAREPLVVAGLALRHSTEIGKALPRLCARVKDNLAALDAKAQSIASSP